jgi:hypothetical protein
MAFHWRWDISKLVRLLPRRSELGNTTKHGLGLRMLEWDGDPMMAMRLDLALCEQ